MTTDPMVPWLNGVHEWLLELADQFPEARTMLWAKAADGETIGLGDRALVVARVEMERALLDDHTPEDGGRGLICEVCTQGNSCGCRGSNVEWPCDPWRIVAAGWAFMPGFDDGWRR